jgi:hypothetical protein
MRQCLDSTHALSPEEVVHPDDNSWAHSNKPFSFRRSAQHGSSVALAHATLPHFFFHGSTLCSQLSRNSTPLFPAGASGKETDAARTT